MDDTTIKERQQMKQKFQTVKWTHHPCGRGSLFENTKVLREWLPKLVAEFNIVSIADAGAGDLSWIEAVDWNQKVIYTAYDIYPRHKDVIQFDITNEVLPQSDLIICRHVLNHLSPKFHQLALDKFQESKSKFLLLTLEPDGKVVQTYRERWGNPVKPFVKEPMKEVKRKWHYGLWKMT